jgi:hypothetical protein
MCISSPQEQRKSEKKTEMREGPYPKQTTVSKIVLLVNELQKRLSKKPDHMIYKA